MNYKLIERQNNFELPPVERILTNRGIPLEDIPHYLNTKDSDILSPTLIANIKEGAKMLISHIAKRDNIYMVVDCDADGYTSAALMINYLNCLFPSFAQKNIHYTVHNGKEHGFLQEDIDFIIENNFKMVIMIDSSSNDFDYHKKLKEKNIDVLVIDHHEAEKVSEYACVINNQLCDYPTKSLSGVGMAYKFCSYLDMLLEENYANQFLDLVALGICADMMDLRDFETRHLVTLGLADVRNPYFKEMCKVNSFSIKRHGFLDPFAVGFYIAPYVNATIRVGSQNEKLMLFESMLDFRGYEIIPSTKRGCKGQTETRVEQACRNCNNLKRKQTTLRDASLEAIELIIEKENLLNHKLLVIKYEEEGISTLTGYIANQLASTYQRPVLLLRKEIKEGEVYWSGSGRNYSNSRIESFKEFLESTNIIEYAQGHNNAFGFSVSDKNFEKFIEITDDLLKDIQFDRCYGVDLIFNGSDFKSKDIISIGELKSIWGQNVEEPLIAIENININQKNISLMGKDKNPTLKIALNNGVSLIKFGSSEEEYEKLANSDLGCVQINIVGKCELNEWNGSISAQILLEDYEIVGVKKYYF